MSNLLIIHINVIIAIACPMTYALLCLLVVYPVYLFNIPWVYFSINCFDFEFGSWEFTYFSWAPCYRIFNIYKSLFLSDICGKPQCDRQYIVFFILLIVTVTHTHTRSCCTLWAWWLSTTTHTHTNHKVLHAYACETKAGLVWPGPVLVQEA